MPAPQGVVKVNDKELQQFVQDDGSYLVSCENQHKICVNKSRDCFYIFWTPRKGVPTGPNNCVIEKVELYEII